jgi:hypothetical protein
LRILEKGHLRARTLQAMALLCLAHLAVKLLPFRWWRASLGLVAGADSVPGQSPAESAVRARRSAVHVERGATRLPFTTKCLPRAMALCWLLRARGIAYVFKIAARPAAARQAGLPVNDGNLHAWVESGGATVIGALPGPWLVVLILRG